MGPVISNYTYAYRRIRKTLRPQHLGNTETIIVIYVFSKTLHYNIDSQYLLY